MFPTSHSTISDYFIVFGVQAPGPDASRVPAGDGALCGAGGGTQQEEKKKARTPHDRVELWSGAKTANLSHSFPCQDNLALNFSHLKGWGCPH